MIRFPCPICGTSCQEDWLTCPSCGWDVTPESRLAIAQHPSHLYWGRSLWQRLQGELALKQRLEAIEQRLSHLEQSQASLDESAEISGKISELDEVYSPLALHLAQQEWREADYWTWQRILEVAEIEGRDWLDGDEIAAFPQRELQTLNELWYAYSEGRLGWSVQAEIWWTSRADYSRFCDRVHWRSGGTWLYYDDLNFHRQAPMGHFPVLPWRKRACYGLGGLTAAETLNHWMTRFPPFDLDETVDR